MKTILYILILSFIVMACTPSPRYYRIQRSYDAQPEIVIVPGRTHYNPSLHVPRPYPYMQW